MNFESEYYTPDITEFYLEFEYEQVLTPYSSEEDKEWKRLTYKGNIYSILNKDPFKEIRVKYLDEEDIVSLGFELLDYKRFCDTKRYIIRRENFDDIYLNFIGSTNTAVPWVRIYSHDKVFNIEHKLFWGRIKNKSELKTLLKQVVQ